MSAPVIAIVPSDEFPPATPFTSQARPDPAGTQSDPVNVSDDPSPTLACEGEIEFVAEHVIVAVALPDFELSAALVAAIVTVGDDGGAGGAVYSPVVALVETMVPTVAFPPAIPFTLQSSPAAGSPLSATVAVNTCAPPVGTFADCGANDIAMLSVRFTAADPLSCGFVWLTAVTVTLAGDGIAVGAV
jgi:hypothetical protein